MTTIIQAIFEAEVSGTLAGMSSNISREDIPSEYAYRIAARDAWLEAFDKMRQSLRGTPVEAPKGAKEPTEGKKPRKPKESSQEAPKVVEPIKPKRMADILPELHHEYA